MNVILLGYRGSGKSTVGRLLAEQLGMRFCDLDQLVVARYGDRSVADIWANEGEAHFRKTECLVAAEQCAQEGQVIALGGGTVMQPDARQAVLAADALRVYLRADSAVLAARIDADGQTGGLRPSLTGKASSGSMQEVVAMLAEREPVYRDVADKVIDVGSRSAEQVAQTLAKWVRSDGRHVQ